MKYYILLILLLLPGFAAGQDLPKQAAKRESNPPLDSGRMVLEITLGTVSGFIGSYMTLIPFAYGGEMSCEKAKAVLASGSVLWSALTVYGIGALGEENGSFGATLGGSAIGGLVQFLIAGKGCDFITPFWFAGYPLQASLATLLFNKTRRWDTKVKTGALFRIEGDNWRADLLNPYPTPVFSYGNKMQWNYNLVHLVF